jgi:hypothetical protein
MVLGQAPIAADLVVHCADNKVRLFSHAQLVEDLKDFSF